MTYKKVLFVCLGNSCSSPLAETIMSNLMVKTSLYWEVDSAGLRTWNIGRRPHKRCLRILREHGLRSDHICRQFTSQDFRYFDYILAMDEHVYRELLLWPGFNRDTRCCEILLLSSFGKKGENAQINELSPIVKLKNFRTAYYQIKECCKQFILCQKVNIVQYELPSSEDDIQADGEEQEQDVDHEIHKANECIERKVATLPSYNQQLKHLEMMSSLNYSQHATKKRQRKLCHNCKNKFMASL